MWLNQPLISHTYPDQPHLHPLFSSVKPALPSSDKVFKHQIHSHNLHDCSLPFCMQDLQLGTCLMSASSSSSFNGWLTDLLVFMVSLLLTQFASDPSLTLIPWQLICLQPLTKAPSGHSYLALIKLVLNSSVWGSLCSFSIKTVIHS